jgi:hypothetical protein
MTLVALMTLLVSFGSPSSSFARIQGSLLGSSAWRSRAR